MKSILKYLSIIVIVLALGWVVITSSYVQFAWKGVIYILDNSSKYSFEPQEPEKIQFTIDCSSLVTYDKTKITDFGESKLFIESIREENGLLRVIISTSYKINYSIGYIIQDLPSPDLAEITAVDQSGNHYEVTYNGSGPYKRRGREYHYLVEYNEDMLSQTLMTITINDVIPIIYRRK